MSAGGNEKDYEFERRFLVEDTSILRDARGDRIEQGYLWAKDGYAVRVRITGEPSDDPLAFFTLKGPRMQAMRYELEQPIAIGHARALYERCTYRISKVRYPVVSEGATWAVDVFEGDNNGLIIAEFEASAGDVAAVRKPWWCSTDITSDDRYNNENLARSPISSWPSSAEDQREEGVPEANEKRGDGAPEADEQAG